VIYVTFIILQFTGILCVGQKLLTALFETCVSPKNATILVLARSQGFMWNNDLSILYPVLVNKPVLLRERPWMH